MTNRYFTIVNILLITIAVYFSISAFYKITSHQLDPVNPTKVTSKRQIASLEDEPLRPLTYYQTIVERNLFNTLKNKTAQPIPIKVETLKQTELNLKLWGTVTGLAGKPYAVIEEAKGRQQNLYRVGDTVQNATVKMILREKVILSVNGKDEILEIEHAQSLTGRKKSL